MDKKDKVAKRVAKNTKKVAKNGCLLRNRYGKEIAITATQLDVLKYLSYPFLLTHEAIAIKRKCRRQAVSKVVKQLKDKGLYSKTYSALDGKAGSKMGLSKGLPKGLPKTSVSRQPFSDSFINSKSDPQPFRFHNFRWTIKLLNVGTRYNIKGHFSFKGHKVKCWEKTIEIYSKMDFWGDTPEDAFYNAMRYWDNQFFPQLENRADITILKEGYMNFSLTKCELANVNNSIAEEFVKDGNKFYVYNDKGEQVYCFDYSHGFFEFEAIRSKSVISDMKKGLSILTQYADEPNLLEPIEMQKKFEQLLDIVGKSNSIQQNNQVQIEELVIVLKEILFTFKK